uniref:Uncharacterized protein n=1 Tax=Anguilla anguilla TaxID=7936 RepID=A0A0E9U9T8_ANGAN
MDVSVTTVHRRLHTLNYTERLHCKLQTTNWPQKRMARLVC